MASTCKVKATIRSLITMCLVVLMARTASSGSPLCTGNTSSGRGFKYIWGDALTDSTDCIGPTGQQYPSAAIARMFRSQNSGGLWGTSSRSGRGMSSSNVLAPHIARKALLRGFELSRGEAKDDVLREGRGKGMGMFSTRPAATKDATSCAGSMPGRLCKTRYNTTAPMYGVSLTSGQPVTIVQKFPDLLQQVVFEVCESSECEVVRGECTQTYVPYLFLVIPLGPVTLTGQDYVLVESGCVCRPQHGGVSPDDGLSALPPLPNF